jgi:hypothetical protein
MTDRPTERDLELDAIDDAFKQAITQFTKDYAAAGDAPRAGIPNIDNFIRDGIARVRAARLAMIAKLD